MMILSIFQLIISFLTPIIVLILGIRLSRTIERNKLGVLKEKEWQVKWADLFLNEAIEFNSNISIITCSLYKMKDLESNSERMNELGEDISKSINRLQDIEWNIKNFSQFGSINNAQLINKQSELFSKIRELLNNKEGDLEKIRILQFEYNQIVRKSHNEILNSTLKNSKRV